MVLISYHYRLNMRWIQPFFCFKVTEPHTSIMEVYGSHNRNDNRFLYHNIA